MQQYTEDLLSKLSKCTELTLDARASSDSCSPYAGKHSKWRRAGRTSAALWLVDP